ncbi:hypothetical protein [Flavisolibacter tropicus]|uniref:Lipocalin-like domain-containing protein n=1 Tax=Flavisolibacter tropicus TaxID=1492898 RepID=A0A172U1W3_9BACT|nr:hypothetical protein [Flavisolibacter tropicus]ANE53114.1 hypothetical protein SY85_24220 [Flavisolibacter tropicus]
MKKALFIICGLISLTASSCDKKNDKTDATTNYDSDLYKKSPRSDVPDALAPGTWTSGNISAIGYYNDNGDHVGNAYSAAREYKVTKDGYFEFAQLLVVEGSTSSCINEYFTQLKGTMKFEGSKLTLYPVEGNFRTVKTSRSASNTSCPKSDTKRPATKEEIAMKPTTYYWKTVTDNSRLYLQVFEESDPTMQGNATFVYEVTK